jgi:small-conductance mechanosensitive channel
MIDLFHIGFDYTFRLSQLLLIILTAGLYWVGRKLIKSKYRRAIEGKGIVIQGKELSLGSLITQAFGFLMVLLVYLILGIDNPGFSLSNLLEYKLISNDDINKFQLSIGQVIAIIIVLFVTRISINIVNVLLYKYFRKRDAIDETKRYTFIQLSRYIIYTIGIVISIKILVGNITGLLIGASALFVGLGLGLREFFTDIVGGIIIYTEGNLKVKDIIELNNEPCKIEKINLRTTQVKTLDGKMIIVPNSKITQENVVNWSLSDKSTRFLVEVNVAYGSDTEKVKSLLTEAAMKHPKVDRNYPVTIFIKDFNERGIEFQLYFWITKTWESPAIQSDVRFAIDRLFREHHISIPAPQRAVNITNP